MAYLEVNQVCTFSHTGSMKYLVLYKDFINIVNPTTESLYNHLGDVEDNIN